MSQQNNDLYSNIELVPDDYLEKNPEARITAREDDDETAFNHRHSSISSHRRAHGHSHSHSSHHSSHHHRHSSHRKKNDADTNKKNTKETTTTHSKKKKHKKWSKRKKILIGILLFFLSLFIIIGIVFAVKRYNGKNKLLSTEEINLSLPSDLGYDEIENGGETIVYKGHTYKFNHNIASILFMGIDHDEFKENAMPSTAGQADALYLMTYDTSNGKIKVLSLNRDTMTDINRYDVAGNFQDAARRQLCLAYAFGDGKRLSAENQVMAVSRLLYNIPINVYYAIDFSSLKILNDDLGGITVTPKYTFASFTKGKKVTLMGEQAVEFVRHRDIRILDDNIRRMACQRQYLNSFASSILPAIKKDLQLPVKLYQHTAEYTVTNLDTDIMVYLASTLAMNYSGLNITTTKGKYVQTSDNYYAQFIINKNDLFETILDFYYTIVK